MYKELLRDDFPGSRQSCYADIARITSTIQYSRAIPRLTCGLYDPYRERSPAVSPDRTPERKSRLIYRSHQALMERQSELFQERQWEIYRRSVAEGMPDSDYKKAVLAGIAHALMRLDSVETSRSPFVEDAARTRMLRRRGV
jgi:hypothetical protein